MFDRATIRLGIGPHSSLFVVHSAFLFFFAGKDYARIDRDSKELPARSGVVRW